MHLAQRQLAKALVWLLAAIVPAQPVLSLDCSCNCPANEQGCCHDESDPTDDHSHCRKPAKCGHEPCSERESPSCHEEDVSALDVAALSPSSPGIRPCNCPDGCDCQVRHDIRPGIVGPSKVQIDCDLTVAALDRPISNGAIEVVVSTSFLSTRHSVLERTALEICAHLCRFAS